MKNSEKFWIGVAVLAGIYLSFMAYKFFATIHEDLIEKTYCGTVIKHSSEERVVKYSTTIDRYLLIDFDDISTRAIEVTPTTYMNTNNGDRVCFTLSNERVNGTVANGYLIIVGGLGAMVDVILVFVGLYYFIVWFNKKLDRE